MEWKHQKGSARERCSKPDHGDGKGAVMSRFVPYSGKRFSVSGGHGGGCDASERAGGTCYPRSLDCNPGMSAVVTRALLPAL